MIHTLCARSSPRPTIRSSFSWWTTGPPTSTAAIVERLAARRPTPPSGPRASSLPDGWYGKPWACLQGYRARPAADYSSSPMPTPGTSPSCWAGRSAALRQLKRRPRDGLPTSALRDVLGAAGHAPDLAAARPPLSPGTVNRARRARDVIANGQFILTTPRGLRGGRHPRRGQARGGGRSRAGPDLSDGGSHAALRLCGRAHGDPHVPEPERSHRGLVEEHLSRRQTLVRGGAAAPGHGAGHARRRDRILAHPTARRSGSRRTRTLSATRP